MACLSGGESRRWTVLELVDRFKNLGICATRAGVTAALAELALELELASSRAVAPARNTDIPALKELEEWFDSQKEIRGIAKLDPFFERTSKLASRRLKRELERRGTLGEFALEPEALHLERIPPEESGFDLLRSDGPDAVGRSGEVESPQSVVQGRPAQGSVVGSGEKES
jgi:hypothetical protein